jgi:hypothetical protein
MLPFHASPRSIVCVKFIVGAGPGNACAFWVMILTSPLKHSRKRVFPRSNPCSIQSVYPVPAIKFYGCHFRHAGHTDSMDLQHFAS